MGSSVSVEDSADSILGAVTLGVIHPPGYPLYTLLGYLFQLLPFGSSAYKVNLLSGVCGSLTLSLMYLTLRAWVSWLPALVCSSSLGLTSVFWFYSTFAKGYTLNTLLLVSTLFLILKFNFAPYEKRKNDLHAICFLFGLGLSHHYPLFILSSISFGLLLNRKLVRLRDLSKGLLFVALGLSPWLYLVIQAYRSEALLYNFGKISDLQDVLRHISRSLYGDEAGGGTLDRFYLLGYIGRSLAEDYLLFVPFILYGIWKSYRRRLTLFYPFLLGAFSTSVILLFSLTFPNDPDHHAFLLQYLLPCYLFIGAFGAIGFQAVLDSASLPRRVAYAAAILAFPTQVYSQVYLGFPKAFQRNDHLVEVWAKALLQTLEPRSALLLCGTESMAIYYFYLIEKVRPDLTVYDHFSLFARDNLYGPLPIWKYPNPIEYQREREIDFMKSSKFPFVYTDCGDLPARLGIPYENAPLAYQMTRDGSPINTIQSIPLTQELLFQIFEAYPRKSHWHEKRRESMLMRLTTYFAMHHDDPNLNTLLNGIQKSRFSQSSSLVMGIATNLYVFGYKKSSVWLFTQVFEQHPEELAHTSFRNTFCRALNELNLNDQLRRFCGNSL